MAKFILNLGESHDTRSDVGFCCGLLKDLPSPIRANGRRHIHAMIQRAVFTSFDITLSTLLKSK